MDHRMWRLGWAVALAVAPLAGQVAPNPAAAELRQVRLAAGKSIPKVEKQSLPAYPANMAADGVIEIDTVVGTDGRVLHTRVARTIASAPGLEQTCVEALAAWRFRAASLNGRIVPSLVGVHFEFVPGARDRAGKVSAQLKLLPRVAPRTREALADVPVIDLMQMPGTPPAGSGYVYPTPVRRVLPEYTEPAIRARLQGSVELEIVILPDGTVGAASIRRSLDRTHGLDGEALIAAQYWLFAPATRNGKPIAVTSRLVLDFTLQ